MPPVPALPAETEGKMPAATHPCTTVRKKVADEQLKLEPPYPHELLAIRGLRAGSGFWPVRSQGASIHCPASITSGSVAVLEIPLVEIHLAPGATPIWLVCDASSPTIVPIVCDPW